MNIAKAFFCAASVCMLAACGLMEDARSPLVAPKGEISWRTIATEDDRGRIRNWRSAFIEGIEKAQRGGYGAQVAREGVLLHADAATILGPPPPGDYDCRVLKLGAKSPGLLDFVSYPKFTCRLRAENGLMSFAKLTGSQRPLGLFLNDNSRRMIFLGTLQLGDERLALEYGRDRERDMAGVVERIGHQRWRLVLPYPHFESTIDIVELVPTTPLHSRT